MIVRRNILGLFCFLVTIHLAQFCSAEPLIVLEFSSENQFSPGDGKNPFSMDPNYSDNYTVKSGDSLNSILKQFYKGSGLDWRFVQLSIVIANPKAFAKSNPNFLFSDTNVYLPGRSDISKLLLGKKVGNINADQRDASGTKNIYFFGG
jgi:hypothetical protein